MMKQVKSKGLKWLAVLLSVMMLLSTIPGGALMQVLAATVTFEVTVANLPEGVETTVTLTDDNDARNTFSVQTAEGNATFENVDDETTYTLSVPSVGNYKPYTEASVSVSEPKTVTLAAKGNQTIAFASSTMEKTYGNGSFTLSLSNPGSGTGAVTYTSSERGVATIDGATVTIVGAGATTITATKAADDNYTEASATLTLTVNKADRAIWYDTTAVSWQYDTNDHVNTITTATGVDSSKIIYEADNDAVTVKRDGKVTVKKKKDMNGETSATITATYPEDANYQECKASYTITFMAKDTAIWFMNGSITKAYGEASYTEAARQQDGATGTVTYSIQNPEEGEKVASIDESTGEVTICGVGTATITAHYTPDNQDDYEAMDASYTLTVAKKVITFGDIKASINFGQEDPDLTKNIEAQIREQLVGTDKDNDEMVARLAKYVTFAYPKSEDAYRPAGVHVITFSYKEDEEEANKEAHYTFDFSQQGTLTVGERDSAPEDSYTVQNTVTGVDKEQWGQSVTISANEGYSISTNIDTPVWNSKISYEEEESVSDHTFYVRAADGTVFGPETATFGIDTTAPAVIGFAFEKAETTTEKVLRILTFGIFSNNNITMTVTAQDTGSGVGSITASYGMENEKTELQMDEGSFKLDETDNTKATATFTLTAEKFKKLTSVYAYATDIVGNTMSTGTEAFVDGGQTRRVQIEETAPIISIEKAEPLYTDGDNKDWYGGDVEFTVTVTDTVTDEGETNSGIYSIEATVKTAEKTADGPANYTFNGEAVATFENSFKLNTNTNQIEKSPADGQYTVTVTTVDNAGNESTAEQTIYIDREAPEVKGFGFKPAPAENLHKSDAEVPGTSFVTEETYGYFFAQDTEVTVSVTDAAPSSGVKAIFFGTKGVGEKEPTFAESTDFAKNDEGVYTATFTVPAGFKGQIYAYAVDNVFAAGDDNSPKHQSKTEKPQGTVVETQEQHNAAANTGVNIALPKTDKADDVNNPLYAGNVEVTLTAQDSVAGIGKIEWSVEAPYNKTEEDPKGTVTVSNYLAADVPAAIDGWTVEGNDKNLVTAMSKKITVSNNSNDIVIQIKLTDRAGNTSEITKTISIDKTAPTIAVQYDNNTADKEYTSFYKADRRATITVTERNFDAGLILATLKNTGKNVLPELKWTESKNAEDPDKSTYVATIDYTADGDYEFAISCTDRAGNASNKVTDSFTMDQTKPLVDVSYDNNAAANGNYYKADRIATVTVMEHNFDAKRIHVIGSATDRATGKTVTTTFPTISSWRAVNEDQYAATIAYTADSKYSFDIEIADMAGNSIDDYKAEEFYIDKTAPSLTITGVEDKSANADTVAPRIAYSDTNFNKNAVSISLSGVHNGKGLVYDGGYANTTNGQVYTYADFAHEQEVDDIYTLTARLTDMAGNETTKTITFSANRFGSVYDLTASKALIGQYVQMEQDVVFTETNVDTLDRKSIKVKVTKDGTPINDGNDLKEGKDYTVGMTGGNGEWSVYTYTVHKELFAADGRYSVTVYSEDAAENINENIDETKEAEISFGVDKTKPVIVPVNLEEGTQYAEVTHQASAEIKDNLVLDNVKIYLNDQEIKYTAEGEIYTFDIPESGNKQAVKFVAADAAGNECELAVGDFLVSTNFFVRWYNNTPLFVGSIVGVAVVVLGLIALILFGKKKSSDKK